MDGVARVLIFLGVALLALGGVLLLLARLHLPLGRMPGDVVYRGKHATIYVPLATSLLLSLLITLVLKLVTRR